MQDVAVYCVCFPKHEPLRNQVYQKNIMCNAANVSDKYRKKLTKKNYVFDDVGDNISELNWSLGDLTATYWAWKNSEHEFVGTSQYRRFWSDDLSDILFEENTLYVQDPILFTTDLKEHYTLCHGELGISFLEELSRLGEIPLTQEMLDKTYSLRYIHACNMFIAHKETYDKFCEVLFQIIFAVYEKYKDVIKELDPYNKRTPAFLAERIVTALVVNKEHFFPGLKIKTLDWKVIKPSVFQRIYRKK